MSAGASGSRVLGVAVVAVLLATAVAVSGGSEDRYRVRLQMDNANGLREGSAVEVGGITRGEVTELTTDSHDNVVAELSMEPDSDPVGVGARVSIKTKNLLGEKIVRLDLGDTSRPQPTGSVIPRSRIEESVDLDEILNVLAPDTRAKLAVLIGEAGGAVAGRRRDLSSLLRQLPPSFDAATELVDQLIGDNRTLGRLIDRSDRFVARFAAERTEFARLLDTTGQAASTVAARKRDLRRTLAAAPRTLASLNRFLTELEAASEPLGPAARAVTASAPGLTSTLTALPPFQRSARPVLAEATRAAPRLTALGNEATPVSRLALPTLRSLTSLSRTAGPLGRTLEFSIDDLLATLHGWSRAIQGRDGLSHMFRAKVAMTPDSLRPLITGFSADERRSDTRERTRPQPGRSPVGRAGAAPEAQGQTHPRAERSSRRAGSLPEPDGIVDQPTEYLRGLVDYLLAP